MTETNGAEAREPQVQISVQLTPDASLLMVTFPVTVLIPIDPLIQAIQQRAGLQALVRHPSALKGGKL